jgi:hypothetical protein
MTTYTTVPHDHIFDVPPSVAVCPYCGGKLTVQAEDWVEMDDGTWGVLEDATPHADCETEPDDIESDEWEDWFESHSRMPYVYQMPVEIKIAKWLNANYRFDMEAREHG